MSECVCVCVCMCVCVCVSVRVRAHMHTCMDMHICKYPARECVVTCACLFKLKCDVSACVCNVMSIALCMCMHAIVRMSLRHKCRCVPHAHLCKSLLVPKNNNKKD